MTTASDVQSPRLAALQRALAGGGRQALRAFWDEIAVTGAPLIEPLADEPGRCLVTFLWRASEPLENVVAFILLTSADFADMRLARLGASDVWYRTYTVRSDVRSLYLMAPNDSLESLATTRDWATRARNWQPDPLNPRLYLVQGPSEQETGFPTHMSVLELPNAAPQPWAESRPDTPAGTVTQLRFASAILDNERDVWVYTPPDIAGAEPPALLLMFDGAGCVPVLGAPTTLDNLQATGAIPPTVAVMVGNVDRGTELPCNAAFARSLVEELLPWLRAQFTFTDDPARSVVAGQSYGGLAAAYCAFQYPDVFGNVLSQSGSFWWKPDPFTTARHDVAGEADEYEWLVRQYVAAPRKPLRFYLDIGRLEGHPLSHSVSHLDSNRHMRDVLLCKGYDLTYHEYMGGHDYNWWRGTLADGLLALLGREVLDSAYRSRIIPKKSDSPNTNGMAVEFFILVRARDSSPY